MYKCDTSLSRLSGGINWHQNLYLLVTIVPIFPALINENGTSISLKPSPLEEKTNA